MHDHRASLDPNTNRQVHVVLADEPLVQRRHLVDRKAGAYRALSVVFVCFRPAEVNHQPVAKILGNMTAKTGDRCCRGYLILGGDTAPVFRIRAAISVELARSENRTVR